MTIRGLDICDPSSKLSHFSIVIRSIRGLIRREPSSNDASCRMLSASPGETYLERVHRWASPLCRAFECNEVVVSETRSFKSPIIPCIPIVGNGLALITKLLRAQPGQLLNCLEAGTHWGFWGHGASIEHERWISSKMHRLQGV